MEDKNKISERIVVTVIVFFTATGVIFFLMKDYYKAAINFGIVAALNCIGLLLMQLNKQSINKKLF